MLFVKSSFKKSLSLFFLFWYPDCEWIPKHCPKLNFQHVILSLIILDSNSKTHVYIFELQHTIIIRGVQKLIMKGLVEGLQ